ncbi:hypothetical protein BLAT2472_130002 [Burkholderia latens]
MQPKVVDQSNVVATSSIELVDDVSAKQVVLLKKPKECQLGYERQTTIPGRNDRIGPWSVFQHNTLTEPGAGGKARKRDNPPFPRGGIDLYDPFYHPEPMVGRVSTMARDSTSTVRSIKAITHDSSLLVAGQIRVPGRLQKKCLQG